jgi:hypothetical protein
MGQLWDLLDVWNVVELNYVHGQRRAVSPRSHWDDVLNAEPNGEELILYRLGRDCRRDAFDNHPVRFEIVPDQIKWDVMLFQEGLQVEVIFIRHSLARYASFYSVGCEAYRLELGMKILVKSGHVTLEVMMSDYRRDYLSWCG